MGSTTVICTDKTGTLTRKEMTVRVIRLEKRSVDITGSGYTAVFHVGRQRLEPRGDDHLLLALRIGALCNDGRIDYVDGRTSPESKGLVSAGRTSAACMTF